VWHLPRIFPGDLDCGGGAEGRRPCTEGSLVNAPGFLTMLPFIWEARARTCYASTRMACPSIEDLQNAWPRRLPSTMKASWFVGSVWDHTFIDDDGRTVTISQPAQSDVVAPSIPFWLTHISARGRLPFHWR